MSAPKDLYTVFKETDAEENLSLSEIFAQVDGVTVVSAAVSHMATLHVTGQAMEEVRRIAENNKLGIARFRGVELS